MHFAVHCCSFYTVIRQLSMQLTNYHYAHIFVVTMSHEITRSMRLFAEYEVPFPIFFLRPYPDFRCYLVIDIEIDVVIWIVWYGVTCRGDARVAWKSIIKLVVVISMYEKSKIHLIRCIDRRMLFRKMKHRTINYSQTTISSRLYIMDDGRIVSCAIVIINLTILYYVPNICNKSWFQFN